MSRSHKLKTLLSNFSISWYNNSIKKAKISTGMYTIYHQGGLMAGYTQFAALAGNDEKYLAYVYQPEEFEKFNEFFKRFSGK